MQPVIALGVMMAAAIMLPASHRHLTSFTDFRGWDRAAGDQPGTVVITSPEVTVRPAREAILSWNTRATAGSGLRAEVRALGDAAATRWYCLGDWSPDGLTWPRQSLAGQKDSDGNVLTDTLVLASAASRFQIRFILRPDRAGALPALTFAALATEAPGAPGAPAAPAAGSHGSSGELDVPCRSQLGWPDGSGWCSPTSVSMLLAYWARVRHRPEWDLDVPAVAHGVDDPIWNGTGNWAFNAAYAGSLPGMRAYVTRLDSMEELAEWTAAGVPPVVSVSYDLLLGKKRDEDPGHLMVCRGFAPDGRIILNDPCFHPERGEVGRRVFTREAFARAWKRSSNLIYLIYPEEWPTPPDRLGHWGSPRSALPDTPR